MKVMPDEQQTHTDMVKKEEHKSPVEIKTNQMHCECYENSTDCIS